MLNKVSKALFSSSKAPVTVSVTGGSGNIAYSLLFRIASGSLFGKGTPVNLRIFDLPVMQNALKGVVMELNDGAFPEVNHILATADEATAFEGAEYLFMVGSKPRGPGMERSDLLKQNGEIFLRQGEFINKHASRNAKVIVVGNPANTNCLILQSNCPGIPKENFTAMTRLDHNRAVFQIANYLKTHVTQVEKLAIWGNHSSTMYPDVSSATVGGKLVTSQIDIGWLKKEFIPVVQQRGAAIIEARKASSAASAASASVDHMRDWALGSAGKWVSMGVPSDLMKGAYGIPGGLIFSYPVTTEGGDYKLVEGLVLDEFSKEKIQVTTEELLSERKAVEGMLKN